MILETAQLPPMFSPYIETIFHFREFTPDHSIERVVPTGHVFIIFELDGFERHTFDNETLQVNACFSQAWLSGLHRHYISISAHQRSAMLVVQFKPAGAYPFLHFPLHKITGKIVDATELWGNELAQLRQRLLDQSVSSALFEAIYGWLRQKFDPRKLAPLELYNVLQALEQAPVTNHQQAVEGYPNTQKHLIDQFKKYVGLTPKYYHRILRFQEILKRIQHQEKITWADITYHCGYADQSHFIKEFKHFSGFNPSEFILKDHHQQGGNFFPLD
ncbi:helix-turn-helix domain-containing protein [uncultured Microscilla sp.]|uniref:helix-turn-helix domain-containing protein n=1 Tax=uncultured Microscilla sp. TaxID=432653 RepID=UPI00260EA3D5|nr:helix-turn-helix domain-containing protein [uncultured Microscilla sp.]